MTQKPRLRFAPSPTGRIHIGNIRTALFNWLYARHIDGEFVLRVEDTDATRSEQEYEYVIYKGLKWLGIDWDEGPDVGGPYTPYRQSERKDIYTEHAQKLVEAGKAYYCFCTDEDLENMREAQRARGEMPRYNRQCASLTEEECQKMRDEGKIPAIRFSVPKGEHIVVNDLIKGRVDFESDGFGDFVILKSDGMPSYNFACVVDDHLMDITHVIRGEDHLSNTPRQVMVYQAFGFEVPQFGHLSLILGHDKAKLSKRHGDTFIGDYQEKGYLPEAMMNFLALLGWSPPGEQELYNKDELIELFDISRVSKSAAVFDVNKLNWMNAHYIKEADDERLFDLSEDYILEAGLANTETELQENRDWFVRAIALVKERVEMLSQLPEHLRLFIGNDVSLTEEELEMVSENPTQELLSSLKDRFAEAEDFDPQSVKKIINETGKTVGVKGKKLFMPVRIAVSGETKGPELDQLISLLGKDKVVSRIGHVLDRLN